MSERPLIGHRMLVTRAKEQAYVLSNAIKMAGGVPIEVPLIAFRAVNEQLLKKEMKRLYEYDWLIFTSANGVRYTLQSYAEHIKQFRDHFQIAVVGEKTAEALLTYGLMADLLPSEYVAEDLLDTLHSKLKPTDKVLVARGQLGRATLIKGMVRKGIEVKEIVVYETYCPTNHLEFKCAMQLDPTFLIFTSSSTVRHFVQLCSDIGIELSSISSKIACIGPIAKKSAMQSGLKVDVMPRVYTIEALVEEIITYLEEEKRNGSTI
ncbi:uroporphyrinogen-III synthase [Bacillus sp. JCM 19034]|uniref:uroporphyrinogen-III synthase n=1 Tax=Bacillus sp. JCM 19034 TaxID=1481928 RepID=UPI0007811199|nr:uroporphyrinogen-III synthase [Bacillus sp. JCM 19034]